MSAPWAWMPALAQRPPGISTSLVTGPGAYGLSALANIIKGVHRPYRIALNGEVLEGEFTPIFCRQRPLVWQRIPPLRRTRTPVTAPGCAPGPACVPAPGGHHHRQVQTRPVCQLSELIRHVRTRHLEVQCSAPAEINLDGELRWAQQVQIGVAKENIRFFLPQGSHLESPFQGVRICIKRLGGAAAASSGCIFQLYAGEYYQGWQHVHKILNGKRGISSCFFPMVAL